VMLPRPEALKTLARGRPRRLAQPRSAIARGAATALAIAVDERRPYRLPIRVQPRQNPGPVVFDDDRDPSLEQRARVDVLPHAQTRNQALKTSGVDEFGRHARKGGRMRNARWW